MNGNPSLLPANYVTLKQLKELKEKKEEEERLRKLREEEEERLRKLKAAQEGEEERLRKLKEEEEYKEKRRRNHPRETLRSKKTYRGRWTGNGSRRKNIAGPGLNSETEAGGFGEGEVSNKKKKRKNRKAKMEKKLDGILDLKGSEKIASEPSPKNSTGGEMENRSSHIERLGIPAAKNGKPFPEKIVARWKGEFEPVRVTGGITYPTVEVAQSVSKKTPEQSPEMPARLRGGYLPVRVAGCESDRTAEIVRRVGDLTVDTGSGVGREGARRRRLTPVGFGRGGNSRFSRGGAGGGMMWVRKTTNS